MKKIILSLMALALVTNLFASEEEAKNLYAKRGADKNNAKKAADLYGALADGTSDVLAKANFKISQSEAIHYFGTKLMPLNIKAD